MRSYDLMTRAARAEISGVDMSQPLGNQLFQEVHDALIKPGHLLPRATRTRRLCSPVRKCWSRIWKTIRKSWSSRARKASGPPPTPGIARDLRREPAARLDPAGARGAGSGRRYAVGRHVRWLRSALSSMKRYLEGMTAIQAPGSPSSRRPSRKAMAARRGERGEAPDPLVRASRRYPVVRISRRPHPPRDGAQGALCQFDLHRAAARRHPQGIPRHPRLSLRPPANA